MQDTTTYKDPRTILNERPMTLMQIVVVGLCVLMNAIDGFDVLSISFASPGIAADWGIDRGALGVVLAAELIGMAFGSIILGNVADRIGRRPIIIGCLVVMTLGMFVASVASNIETLLIIRLFTGFGIGGMLAVTNAMVAEFSNNKNRSLAVVIMGAGYPVGAIVGGAIASKLLETHTWHSVFILGGILGAVLLPLVWWLMPESVGFQLQKRPQNVLERINRTLSRLGQPRVESLPEVQPNAPKVSMARLFAPDLARTTIFLVLAYAAHIMTFYYILKWIPKIVVDMGYEPSTAGSVLVWANVGGLTGALAFSLLTRKFKLKTLIISTLLVATVMVSVFGLGQSDLNQLALVAAIAGFFTNAGVVGFYALTASSFPTEVRAGGTGVVIGIGRGGAALGPIIAGFLFQQGGGLLLVSVLMALGSLIAAALVFMVRSRAEEGA